MASENLAPQVISRLMSEIRDLIRNPSEGVEYVDNEENSVSEIHAVLVGPEETPFYGGKFRLKLIISEEYPNVPPKGYFLTKIFHPNVANNGDICVNTLKKDWSPQVTLKHILQVIRCLLIIPFPESSLNDEAGKLFMESYDEYSARAKIMTEVHAMASESKVGKLSAGDEEGNGGTESSLSTKLEGSNKLEDSNSSISQKKKTVDVKKKNMKRL
jgi:ubiquitin-conjugating enzyme E2 S